MFGSCFRSEVDAMHRIIYCTRIKKRGPLGIGYTVLKLRTAHVDDANWQRLRHRRFSFLELMLPGCGAAD